MRSVLRLYALPNKKVSGFEPVRMKSKFVNVLSAELLCFEDGIFVVG